MDRLPVTDFYSALSAWQPPPPELGFGLSNVGVPTMPGDIAGLGTGGFGVPGVDPTAFSRMTADGGMFSSLNGWMKDSGFLGSRDANGMQVPGWGGMALGAAQGLASAYMGKQQLNLAKQQLAEGKRQFTMNFDAQKQTVNSQLEDRQRSRVASNPTAYQSVGDYMTKNGVR